MKLAWRRGLIDQLWSRKLDSSGKSTDQDLDVCAIAEALEDSGVTKDPVILVWHSTYYDLTLLGNFLGSAGANSPLPSGANCVRLVPHVRANVPPHNGKPFPATLSTIFPILFPSHELVGRNHRALVDCQQTRLVMTAFEECAKPISPATLELRLEKIMSQSGYSVGRQRRTIRFATCAGNGVDCFQRTASEYFLSADFSEAPTATSSSSGC